MVIARDVTSGRPGAAPLLRRGVVLTPRYRDRLLQEGVNAVYVDDELGSDIEVPHAVADETRREAESALATAFARVKVGASPAALPEAAIEEFARVASMIAADVATCDDAAVALADLAAADAYTLQHSIDVTVLGLLVAKHEFTRNGWLDFTGRRSFGGIEEKLARIGLGLILHDIGKLTVPASILHKASPLTDAEWKVMRRHPEAGVDLLRSDLVSPLVKGVVRSHHERWDGAGYPEGRAGDEIFHFARIAAVADCYDAVTSDRPYARARSPREGWQAVVDGAGSAFDPAVVDAFRAVVAPYPPGSELVLADGRRAVVISVPADDLEHPQVRLADDRSELDLAKVPELLARAA